jgi:hypothetical protein
MKWTFGLITDGSDYLRNRRIIDSIFQQKIPEDSFEVIVVGGAVVSGRNITHVTFDERPKSGHITKKKNIVFKQAKFDNISIGHDYIQYDHGWYDGFEKFGEDWDCSMAKIINKDGLRFRDWVSWYNDGSTQPDKHTVQFIDYNDNSKTDKMYISGAYYCIKKQFALKYKLDESKTWGFSEDVDFSLRARNSWNYRMNQNSSVSFLKMKDHWPLHK